MKDVKKEMTIEELEKEYTKITEERQLIAERLQKKRQEEEDRRIAQLALEKENRKKELDTALENAKELLQKWIEDYGPYSYSNGTTRSILDFILPKFF